jgi:hypothetical protein
VTITETVVEAGAVPAPVEAKRLAILEAAESGDADAVAALAGEPFSYSFGGPVEGGPAAYWRELEANGERPLEALAAILRMPYTLSTGLYVWPFAYDKTIDQITDYERELLGPLPPDAADFIPEGGYFGWRAGIEPDGDWIFFVSGD